MELQELVDKYSGYFIVNYDNFEVIYSQGYENENGLWCYKISDLNKMPEIQNQSQEGESQEQSEENQNIDETSQEKSEVNVEENAEKSE